MEIAVKEKYGEDGLSDEESSSGEEEDSDADLLTSDVEVWDMLYAFIAVS